MEVHIKVIGIALMILAMIHFIFPKYFNWKAQLESLDLINKEMMVIHTFFIAFTVFLMGLLCFTNGEKLIQTELGKTLCLGFGIFWFVRLLVQFFGYSSKLWKGKIFETMVHIIFSLFWFYCTLIFLLVYFN